MTDTHFAGGLSHLAYVCYDCCPIHLWRNLISDSNRVYQGLLTHLRTFWPRTRITQVRNLGLVATGIYQAKSCQLSKIAAKLPIPGRQNSRTKRVFRCISNQRIAVSTFYEPIARQLLAALAHVRLWLLIDTTTIEERMTVIFVALAYRHRALPLAWIAFHPGEIATSQNQLEEELLALVRQWLPEGVSDVVVVGDRAYGRLSLVQYIKEKLHWHYLLREAGDTMVRLPDGQETLIKNIPLRPGERRYFPGCGLKKGVWEPVNLVLSYPADEETRSEDGGTPDPWYLITDLPPDGQRPREYGRRMWLEEMIRDFKSQGLDVEKSRIDDCDHLERLLLAVALVYLWLLNAGLWVLKTGRRRSIDNQRKRSLSLFTMGDRWVSHRLALGEPLRFSYDFYVT